MCRIDSNEPAQIDLYQATAVHSNVQTVRIAAENTSHHSSFKNTPRL